MHQYRNHIIWRNLKPIPTRILDWDWCHKNFDGTDDKREGHAATLEAAKNAIDDLIKETEKNTMMIIARVIAQYEKEVLK